MRICMVSDFFYPNMGGVEEHIFNLSQCLLTRRHKIIVITHSYGDRQGVRYMTNGLKVYYLPIRTCYNQCILPTMIANVPLLRYILLRERIEIVHGHSAFSALAHETMLVGKLLGLRTVFTDHSLFGFADLSAVLTNKLLEISLANCNHCICVSHTCKENTVLRAKVPEDNVSVIPNAVDTAHFTPNPINRPTDDTITVVIVSRLVYRKGVDLMAGVITRMKDTPGVNFIIGGDGPKRDLLEEIREKANMQSRVTMLGALEHSKGTTTTGMQTPNGDNDDPSSERTQFSNVRDVLTMGHIFLNTSLTEAYCMAIVEAASCGLQVVSTSVGGIPEVLPPSLIILTEPNIDSVLAGLHRAIARLRQQHKPQRNGHGPITAEATQPKRQDTKLAENAGVTPANVNTTDNVPCPFACNETVMRLYNWQNVAQRTERVYARVLREADTTFGEKLTRCGHACVPFMLVMSFIYLLLEVLEWWVPVRHIDIAVDWAAMPSCASESSPKVTRRKKRRSTKRSLKQPGSRS